MTKKYSFKCTTGNKKCKFRTEKFEIEVAKYLLETHLPYCYKIQDFNMDLPPRPLPSPTESHDNSSLSPKSPNEDPHVENSQKIQGNDQVIPKLIATNEELLSHDNVEGEHMVIPVYNDNDQKISEYNIIKKGRLYACNEESNQCKKKKLGTSETMRSHSRKFHNTELNLKTRRGLEALPFKCPKCLKPFARKQTLDNHQTKCFTGSGSDAWQNFDLSSLDLPELNLDSLDQEQSFILPEQLMKH